MVYKLDKMQKTRIFIGINSKVAAIQSTAHSCMPSAPLACLGSAHDVVSICLVYICRQNLHALH